MTPREAVAVLKAWLEGDHDERELGADQCDALAVLLDHTEEVHAKLSSLPLSRVDPAAQELAELYDEERGS